MFSVGSKLRQMKVAQLEDDCALNLGRQLRSRMGRASREIAATACSSLKFRSGTHGFDRELDCPYCASVGGNSAKGSES